MGKKIYAVRKGYAPGIYYTWDECKKQTNGYSNAEFKSFFNIEDAYKYLNNNKIKNLDIVFSNKLDNIIDIYVDGSYKNGIYSYGFIAIKDDNIINQECGYGRNKEAATMQNVAGELKATMQAVKWLAEYNKINNTDYKCIIHHDYIGISNWINGIWPCKKEYTKKYKEYILNYKDIIYSFAKVKAHSNNYYNNCADKLAKSVFDMM